MKVNGTAYQVAPIGTHDFISEGFDPGDTAWDAALAANRTGKVHEIFYFGHRYCKVFPEGTVVVYRKEDVADPITRAVLSGVTQFHNKGDA